MTAKLVHFPGNNLADIPATLRNLAEQIERGEFGVAENLAWVIDCGENRVETGLIGKSAKPQADAHYLFAKAQFMINLSNTPL